MEESFVIWDLGALTLEPDDPALRGHDPGHPRYYILGGRPLTVNEIEGNPSSNFLRLETKKLPKDQKKRALALLRLKAQAEKALAIDIARYEEIVAKGRAALSRYDILMSYGLETALFLKHNHISYQKSLLAEIKAQLNGPQKLLFE
jgi:hypothetical protein